MPSCRLAPRCGTPLQQREGLPGSLGILHPSDSRIPAFSSQTVPRNPDSANCCDFVSAARSSSGHSTSLQFCFQVICELRSRQLPEPTSAVARFRLGTQPTSVNDVLNAALVLFPLWRSGDICVAAPYFGPLYPGHRTGTHVGMQHSGPIQS